MSIVNRVAESGLIQFDPAILVKDITVSAVSLSDFLNDEPILREKPFRQLIADHDWAVFAGQYVAIQIDKETLVPQWATMLLTSYLEPYALGFVWGIRPLHWIWLMKKLWQNSALRTTVKKISLLKGVAMGRYPIGFMFG